MTGRRGAEPLAVWADLHGEPVDLPTFDNVHRCGQHGDIVAADPLFPRCPSCDELDDTYDERRRAWEFADRVDAHTDVFPPSGGVR